MLSMAACKVFMNHLYYDSCLFNFCSKSGIFFREKMCFRISLAIIHKNSGHLGASESV